MFAVYAGGILQGGKRMHKAIKTLALVTMGVAVGRVGKKRINHYITKYEEDDNLKVESWVQIDVFGKSYCLSKQSIRLNGF